MTNSTMDALSYHQLHVSNSEDTDEEGEGNTRIVLINLCPFVQQCGSSLPLLCLYQCTHNATRLPTRFPTTFASYPSGHKPKSNPHIHRPLPSSHSQVIIIHFLSPVHVFRPAVGRVSRPLPWTEYVLRHHHHLARRVGGGPITTPPSCVATPPSDVLAVSRTNQSLSFPRSPAKQARKRE